MSKPSAGGPKGRLQIVGLTIENIKRVQAAHIEPNGSLVVVSGKNGAGKSTVLDAIWWALQGKKVIQGEPIRRGETEGMIRVDFGRLVVTRYFQKEEGGEYTTSLTVNSADGETFASPQHLLDQFYASLSFDPLAFMRRDKKGQVDDLRRLVNIDLDFDAIDRQNRTDFDKRTEVNRRVKSLQERVAAAGKDLDGLGIRVGSVVETSAIDTAALLAEMEKASAANADVEREKIRREGARLQAENVQGRVSRLRDEAEAARKRAEELDAEADRMEADRDKILAELDALPELDAAVDVAQVRAKIEQANVENARRQKIRDAFAKRDSAAADLAAAEAEYQAFTDAIAARNKSKDDALAAAKMPIEGLAFGEGEVLYNGLPIDQASSGEKLRVAASIGFAMNPELGVVLMKDAAFLDEDGVEFIRAEAERRGYQAWIERVGTDGRVGIIMEAGQARVAG